MKVRLLVTKKCHLKCEKCSNKQFDLDNLPSLDEFHKFDEVIITGGEPYLYPDKLHNLIGYIKGHSSAKIYIYSAHFGILNDTWLLSHIDGITFTIHKNSQFSLTIFKLSEFKLAKIKLNHNLTLILYIENDLYLVSLSDYYVNKHLWDKIKYFDMIDNCEIKEDLFAKLPKLFEDVSNR